jgi:integrase
MDTVGDVDAEVLESLYAECRRCADHCDGRPYVQHRTAKQHKCDSRCGPHSCKPLAVSTIRHIHFLLSGAYKRAIKWHWGFCQSGTPGGATGCPEAQPTATYVGPGGCHCQRSLERSRLGRFPLDVDDDWRTAR